MKQLSIKKMILAIAALLFMAGCMVACGANNPAGTYVIRVVTAGGLALEDVDIKVYTDETKEDIVAVGSTNEEGLFSFESKGSVGDVIYLENVPTGYVVQDNYEIKLQDSEVILEARLLSEDELDGIKFQLGDGFADLSVTAPDGQVYTISEILKEKKAVVLNFWYHNCAPCRMEFPFLQEAYEKYKDELEVLAINVVDGNNKSITNFQKENLYTFPMTVGDGRWSEHIDLSSYPTTIVIDRYGTVAFMHHGMLTSTQEFESLFEFFTADDYTQTKVRKINSITIE